MGHLYAFNSPIVLFSLIYRIISCASSSELYIVLLQDGAMGSTDLDLLLL